MISALERLVWASLSGGVAALAVVLLCRIPGIDPRGKVWLCRICYVKLFLSVLTGFAFGLPWLASSTGALGKASPPAFFWLAAWLVAIWVAGILVVARHTWLSLKFARACADSAAPAGNELSRETHRLATRTNLRRVPTLGESALIGQPCVFWFRRSILLVPKGFDPEEQRHVLAHELAHVRHGDLAWGQLYAAVTALFWFHPLVTFLERETRLWQEAAADQAARRLTQVEPAAQADAIVTALALLNRRERNNVVALGQYGSLDTVTRRVRALYADRHSALLAALVLAVGIAAMAPVRLVQKSPTNLRIASPLRRLEGAAAVRTLELYSGRLQ